MQSGYHHHLGCPPSLLLTHVGIPSIHGWGAINYPPIGFQVANTIFINVSQQCQFLCMHMHNPVTTTHLGLPSPPITDWHTPYLSPGPVQPTPLHISFHLHPG